MSTIEPPRVGYVLKRYPRYSETFIVNEILAHEGAGLEIEIFALRPPTDTHFQDRISRVRAPVHYLPASVSKTASFWSAVRKASDELPEFWPRFAEALHEDPIEAYQAVCLAREIRQRQITHLHAHFATSSTTVARLAALFAGVSYSFTAHAKDIFHEEVQYEELSQKLRDATSVVTVSDYNVDFLQREYGDAATTVRRIFNGLNLDDFPFRTPRNRPNRVVSVGRLVAKKGFSVLIEACALLVARGCDFSCQIVGEGELEEPLKNQIRELGLDMHIDMLGPRPQRDVIELLADAAVFAAPCIVGEDGNRDGLPTVLLESMAVGTPCISTDVTGIPEVIRDGETGLLARQGDAASLADGIERLLFNPDLRDELACRARLLIQEQFDIHSNAAKIRELFIRKPDSAPRSGAAALAGIS